ncbi:hypothetical protein [Rhodoferax sp.]|uniref:hypothetical protein n=1 Tax=Rhodoferax sp. TaxID=50421 RepID=UPI0025D6ED88|nr:hypothetical protein [Rhodoferax sp.]
MKLRITTLLIAACAISTWASGQNTSKNAPATCLAPEALSAVHLYGLWRAEIDGEPSGASVRFQKDPEQDNSVVGSINRDGAKAKPALLAGDVQHGDFQLEESDDGVRISATWSGQVVETSCGKEIKGLWTNALTDQTHPFVLRKQGGWE